MQRKENMSGILETLTKEYLKNENWVDMLITADPDGKFETFHDQLKYLFDLSFPIRLWVVKDSKAMKFHLSNEFLKINDELFALYKKTRNFHSSHYLIQNTT